MSRFLSGLGARRSLCMLSVFASGQSVARLKASQVEGGVSWDLNLEEVFLSITRCLLVCAQRSLVWFQFSSPEAMELASRGLQIEGSRVVRKALVVFL